MLEYIYLQYSVSFRYTAGWFSYTYPLQYSCLGNPIDREAWWAAVHGATELDTAEHTCMHQVRSVAQKSCLTVCDLLDCSMPGLPVLSPTPGVYSNSCPLSWWCHPTISSSVVPFSCLQSFPASVSFPVSQFFTSSGQSTGVSASVSVLPMNNQDWSPLGWTDWISL